ncbi:MAG: diaminopimelate decarboxylase [Calditrichia bacterium]
MKRRYEKPVILKVQTGMMNKYGSSPYYARKVMPEIDSVPVADLIKENGSPLFVFHEPTLRQRYREIYQAFSTRYPNVSMGWSYKTNYLPAICAILHQEGAIAEVVSEMEYDKARHLDIPGDQIIYNGPHKSAASLKKAVEEGAMVNIDHLDELYELEKLADQLGETIPVGMRINMNTGIYPQWSRFGLNLESGQAMDAVKRMNMKGKLRLNGLHCHIGTYILEPDAYAQEIEKMVLFGYQVEDKFDYKMEYLDIGGGFPSRSKLKGTYQSPELLVPPVDEYAEAVTSALYHNLRPDDFPRLYLETGRAVVDEAGYLITTIKSAKRLPDGMRAYIADAGINLLYTAFWYKYNVAIDRPVTGANEPSVIYGPMCMNIDVLEESTMLPPLEKGTRLILHPVGAYNVTQWMQFIEYRPQVVLITEEGTVEVIREAENYSDVSHREKLPERLRIETRTGKQKKSDSAK